MTPRSCGSQPIEPWLPHGIHDRLDIHGFILYHYLTFTMKVATPSVFRTRYNPITVVSMRSVL
jgi:hypothetical protein